jgi:cobalt-zinc-cadmium efflux system protein
MNGRPPPGDHPPGDAPPGGRVDRDDSQGDRSSGGHAVGDQPPRSRRSGHAAGHSHTALARAGARHRGRLWVAFVLVAVLLVVEVVASFLTGSLALLSDAGHMFTDVLGLGMALAAISLADRYGRRLAAGEPVGRNTFGVYRLEVLAAFVNSLLLTAVALFVVVEAARRLAGGTGDVRGGAMLVVAAVGLVGNVVAALLLRPGAGESLAVEGAYLEVVADTLASLAVLVAAAVITATGWSWVDPVVAAAVGVLILPRTIRLGLRAARILLQSAPADIDPAEVRSSLAGLPGVVGVHDLHVWTLTSEMESASAHLTVADASCSAEVLGRARRLLEDRYGIDHATIQIETAGGSDCERLDW